MLYYWHSVNKAVTESRTYWLILACLIFGIMLKSRVKSFL